jgi:cellulose synthase/poly-beta-1,6-N-acetylglucosamine synthase-like glycosyltransferase
MSLSDLVPGLQWFFLLFFIGLNGGYLLLNLVSVTSLWRMLQGRSLDTLPQVYVGAELPVSILVPAWNEQATIVASVRSLLQIDYTEYEVIVINDGSRDATLEVLVREFALQPFPEAYRVRLASAPVRAIYRSTQYPNLRLIDKDNGGKADALNAGINGAQYPLFCSVDADSILQRDSLRRVAQPFLEDPATVAAGGTVRIANGCEVRGGFLTRTALPGSWLARIQIVEYLRAFLFGRLGWSPLNALLVVSGAFALFRKEAVVEAGGYRSDTVGEDMELVVRLHRTRRRTGKPCRITFLPDPVCWTEAPEDLATLRRQRVRWQRGLAESMARNLGLLFHWRGGAAGWLAFPFMLVFEWLGPFIELLGYAFIVLAAVFGLISPQAMLLFLFVAIGFGLLLSVNALFLEEMSFHVYPRWRDTALLLLAAVVENFGYRQLISLWRLWGFFVALRGRPAAWGEMKRRGVGQALR